MSNIVRNEFFFWLLLVVAVRMASFLAPISFSSSFLRARNCSEVFLIASGDRPIREYGAMKLTLYSFFGGALVFIGIIGAY